LQKKGHTLTVDWWCLGCIIYEMITGYPPFRHKNRMQLFEAIISQNFPIPEVKINIRFRHLKNFKICCKDCFKKTQLRD